MQHDSHNHHFRVILGDAEKHLHMNNYEGSTPFHYPFNDDVRRPTGRTDSGYS